MEHSELQSTTRGFFIFADDSTAFGTGKTGLTISSTLAKDSSTANSVSPTITEVSGGWYWVVPLAAHRDTLGRALWQFSASGAVIAGRVEKIILANDQLAAFGANTTTPPTAGAIADAVWDEAYSGHTTAGTFGKLMDTLRKSNNVIEGTILSSPTPTTTVFRISGADYPTGALEHSVLWMSTGTSAEQNSPILTTVNNGDGTLTITLEEALVTAPVGGDTVLIDPTSHVHAIADIASGIWSAASSAYSAATGTMGLIMYAFSQMLEFVTGVWRWKATSLSQAPSGGGGGGEGDYAITLVATSTGGAVPATKFSIVGTSTVVYANSLGVAVVNLDADTYTLRTTPPPGYQPVADSSLVVAADATVTKTLVAIPAPTPPSPSQCLLSVYVTNQSTSPLESVTVTARFPAGWSVASGTMAVNAVVEDVTDSTGLAQLMLHREQEYDLSFARQNGTIAKIRITTPNAASASLSQVYSP
jgi:hypothetical protein